MKKTCFLAFVAMLTLSLSAQHVTPISIHLTEFNLDSLRAQYVGQSYLFELQRLDKLMKDDTKALSDAQMQLKAERNHHKQMLSYIEKAEASYKTLQTLSQKEIDEYNKLKDNVDKQIREINLSSELSQETRTKIIDQLQLKRSELEAAITATTDYQTQLANQPVQLHQMRTDLMVFNNEMINKETDLKQMESTLKSRREIIKAETKNVKSMK